MDRDVVEGFYSDTYAGIRTLIGEQVQGISKKLGKDPKVNAHQCRLVLACVSNCCRKFSSSAALVDHRICIEGSRNSIRARFCSPNMCMYSGYTSSKAHTELQYSWTAVARGAVISILKNRPASISKDPEMTGTNCMPFVASRVARLSYGVEFGQNPANVSPKADDSKDRFYHTPDGRKWVKR